MSEPISNTNINAATSSKNAANTGTSLLRNTGVTDSFYRRAWAGVNSESLTKAPLSPTNSSVDISTALTSHPEHRRSFSSPPVAPEAMERADQLPAASRVTTAGTLMPVGELGHAGSERVRSSESKTADVQSGEDSSKNPRIVAHPALLRARQRTLASIHRSKNTSGRRSLRSVPSITTNLTNSPIGSPLKELTTPSKFTSLTYRGMEVLFGTTGGCTCLGICSRTRLVFQRLDLSSDAKVLCILSNNETGQIVVAQADGFVQTFLPQASDPNLISFGRFRWYNGCTINVRDIFYSSTEKEFFQDALGATVSPGERLDVSLTHNYKILVAHRTQLAVFDVDPDSDVTANLLWTTRLPGRVVTAKIAGDGEAIAVVLEYDGKTDDEAADGVHTFERDFNDGASADTVNKFTRRRSDGRGASRVRQHELVRSRSVGVVYKPGPFLVHSAPVSQLSFRGQGHTTSFVDKSKEQGCDLLLTYSVASRTARIYNQNNWKPLTEWMTPHRTRVEWIRGVTAFSLGDLDNKKLKNSSAPPSRRPSTTTFNTENEINSISETLGKRYPYQSIPNHSTPTTNAGAWVAEISFSTSNGKLPTTMNPTIRISRLNYLKRGVDDLDPTLFENVLAIIPCDLVCSDAILEAGEDAFSVEGIWPAWNVWQSESSGQLISNETIKGSAMAYLGLTSRQCMVGSGMAGSGQFGDSAFGSSTQCAPPSELRICSSHLSGNLVVLEFPMLVDQENNSFELGNPKNSFIAKFDEDNENRAISSLVASTDFNSSRLIAKMDPMIPSISFCWQKLGTLSFLPTSWLPEDASNPERTERLLAESKRFKDESLLPVLFALPSISLLGHLNPNESILSLLWWLDDNFDGPPLLVVLSSRGTIIIVELPPPWASQEPDKLRWTSLFDDIGQTLAAPFDAENDPNRDTKSSKLEAAQEEQTYEVLIVPDPQYGLGLRLEVQADGLPAVAGSYKRHPLTGDMLPAEKGGQITLGDELTAVNEVDLENKSFDDIIATVRDLGASCAGNAMQLTFKRRAPAKTSLIEPSNAFVVGTAAVNHPRLPTPELLSRRSTKEPIDVTVAKNNCTERPQHCIVNTDDNVRSTNGTFLDEIMNEIHVVAYLDQALSEIRKFGQKQAFMFSLQSTTEDGKTSRRSAIIFLAETDRICAVMVILNFATRDLPKSESLTLGSWDFTKEKSCVLEPSSLQVTRSNDEGYYLLVSDSKGIVHLIVANWLVKEFSDSQSNCRLSFKHFELMKLDHPSSSNLLLRSCGGADYLGNMERNENGLASEIFVWSPRPNPGCLLIEPDAHKTVGSKVELHADYSYLSIKADSICKDDKFADFNFVRTGYFDSTPCIIAYLTKQAVLFCKKGGTDYWCPTVQLTYAKLMGSAPNITSDDNIFLLRRKFNTCLQNQYPHILAIILMAYSSSDEKEYLRADWHSETILTHLYTNKKGVKDSILNRVRHMFQWLFIEEKEIFEEDWLVPLIVSPLSILTHKDCDNEKNDRMSALSIMPNNYSLFPQVQKFRELQNALASGCILNSRAAVSDRTYNAQLPLLLRSTNTEDLSIIRAVCDLILEPPSFGALDKCGQHFLLSLVLMSKLRSPEHDPSPSPFTVFPFSPRNTFNFRKKNVSVASSACLSALMSDCQTALVNQCKQDCGQFTWDYMREMRLPLWLRSDRKLALLTEEVGQNLYREKRDIMDCAIFFIIARKMRTLRNLAAADQSESGRKLFKFLTMFDFSSERGRLAAEKNAYSLLRKLRYRVAAAFFLLAQPPSISLALETIVTKLQDIDLAFLVARLMESTDLNELDGHAGFKGLSSPGGILGGGGGYAGVGLSHSSPDALQESKFEDWKPHLGSKGRKMLIERTLPESSNDFSLTALQFLWLDKKDVAAWNLTRAIKTDNASSTLYSCVQEVTDEMIRQTPYFRITCIDNPTLLEKTNRFIDFVSTSSLLDALQAHKRAHFAGSFTLAYYLTGKGIEGASIETICQPYEFEGEAKNNEMNSETDLSTVARTDNYDINHHNTSSSCSKVPPNVYHSSAKFDENTNSRFESSINRIPYNEEPTPAKSENVQSSIFDSFEVPGQYETKFKSTGASKAPTFDTSPQQTCNPTVLPAHAESSIFDDFEVPSRVKKLAFKGAQTQIQSSTYDHNRDIVQQSKVSFKTPLDTPNGTGYMQSSIFDSFDVPSMAKPYVSSGQSTNLQPITSNSLSDPSTTDGSMQQRLSDENEAAFTVPLNIPFLPIPRLWREWRKSLLEYASARRLLREMAGVFAKFHGDPPDSPIEKFYRSEKPLVPSSASGILQISCDHNRILTRIQHSLNDLCKASELEERSIIKCALKLLGPLRRQHRPLFAVVLHVISDRCDLAEDVLRETASDLLQLCQTFSCSNDHIAQQRKTRMHVSTQFLRRHAARLSWQLETCLWLHRGGGLPLSGTALKEVIVAVRIGLMLASWNNNYECLEAMVRNDPDCQLDEETGRQLWTSLKVVKSSIVSKNGSRGMPGGGWEFLVDCRRFEATQMLRDKKTGTFIIRPHSGDPNVFTLSFKTNLSSSSDANDQVTANYLPEALVDESLSRKDEGIQNIKSKKAGKKDDVVQHAIVRLSEFGYRCGSFGPFSTLNSLLEAVSASLPFKLRFDHPPNNRVMKEEGTQPSPNSVLLRKLALSHADSFVSNPANVGVFDDKVSSFISRNGSYDSFPYEGSALHKRQAMFGLFLELLILCAIRKQLSSIAAADILETVTFDNDSEDEEAQYISTVNNSETEMMYQVKIEGHQKLESDPFADSSRFLNPLITWCRSFELNAAHILSPDPISLADSMKLEPSVNIADSATAIETIDVPCAQSSFDSGDYVLRKMIQRDSEINFSTLRLVDGGECTLVVVFSQNDAVHWLVSSGTDATAANALLRLQRMEKLRVIEAIDVSSLQFKLKGDTEGVRYRILDPWEVEALHGWEAETVGASIGRVRVVEFNLGKIGLASESVFRSMGSLPLLTLWTSLKGGVVLTRAIASLHPPWERSAGGDLLFKNGQVVEPPPYENSIRRHLYCNALFRRLHLPQRFLAIVQVELLDLKNLSAPGGSLSMSVYALLRMKRHGSSTILTNKTRTLDTSATHPVKLGKTSGPNAPASWGCVVRFRFPLPENTSVDGIGFDKDREVLFKGPPCVIQVTVYERKLLVDHALGTADIRMDGLWAGGQLEEWVPLRSDKHGITWFARVRLTLRFELMCLETNEGSTEPVPHSVGLRKMMELSRAGGTAHEDVKRSVSSPDLLTYFESIVY